MQFDVSTFSEKKYRVARFNRGHQWVLHVQNIELGMRWEVASVSAELHCKPACNFLVVL